MVCFGLVRTVSPYDNGIILSLAVCFWSCVIRPCLSCATDEGEKHEMGNSLKEAIAKETDAESSDSKDGKNGEGGGG